MVATSKTRSAGAAAFFGECAFYVEERRDKQGRNSSSTIFNAAGEPIGSIVQKAAVVTRVAGIFLKSYRLPFSLAVCDSAGHTLATICRGWGFSRSTIEITDEYENLIGFLTLKGKSQNARIKVFNESSRKVGEVAGSGSVWQMGIIDREHLTAGSITEKAPEAVPPALRGKNTYCVSMDHGILTDISRNLVLLTALAVDRLLREMG